LKTPNERLGWLAGRKVAGSTRIEAKENTCDNIPKYSSQGGGRNRNCGRCGQGNKDKPQDVNPTQETLATGAASDGYAQIAAPAFSSIFIPPQPRLPPPPFNPYQSVYPSFNEALKVAHAIDVPPTIQTLKRLERVELATEDPRPQKRRRSPRVEKDDDVVSLGSSLDEDLTVIAGLSGPTRYGAKILEDNKTDLPLVSNGSTSRDNGSPLDTCKITINFACLSLYDDICKVRNGC